MNLYAVIMILNNTHEMKFELEAFNIINATKDAIATKELQPEARFLEVTKLEITKIK
jgi:hypothetical protein